MLDFVHLRLFTEYSLEYSIVNINKIIDIAKLNNQKALAITDVENLFGSVEFYERCLKKKIKPIIGCEIKLNNKKNKKEPFKLLVIVKNNEGYSNLSKLLSKSYLYKKNIRYFEKDWFKGELSNGLIIITGNESSDIGQALKKNKFSLSEKLLSFWSYYFPNSLYLEIQRSKKKNKNYNNKIINLSNKKNIPLVATHSIFFINKNDYNAFKVRYCILKNISIDNYKKKKLFFKNNYFYSKEKMLKLFKDIPSAIENTFEIYKRCNLILDLEKIKIPIFKSKKINNNKLIIKLSKIGLINRLNLKKTEIDYNSIYMKRLMQECKILISMGLTDYFLIVYDFINWSKKHNFIVGPGRGSGAGSLVAYCLNITDLDPIKYNLLFERFLNPKRISMPDFDIDFCPQSRDKVVNYVKKKYGLSYVCHIITFGKMATKAALKDIGRVLNYNYNFVDKISKLLPFKYNELVNIKNLLNNNPILRERYDKEIEIKKLINLVFKLEGSIKAPSIHAGGIIISTNKIFNFFPIYTQNDIILSPYGKDGIELLGILKFDFLGLTTLTILSSCIKIIKSSKYNINKFLSKINLVDKLCYINLKKGNTTAVFQLESEGMKGMLKKALPNNFENIIALISLYRPGPINLLNNFCLRKLNKEKFDYIDNRLEDILKETYGIIIYQEQVMQIAQKIASFSLENADILRRAMSKKKPTEMLKQREIFYIGALKNGVQKKKIDKIFSNIEKFSGYGFNKSHAAAYSLLSYYTLWLKTYYFPQFMATNMSFCINDLEKLNTIIKESLNNNIFVLPININKSKYNFLYFEKKIKKIRYGFRSIKGIGEKAIFEIINLRNKSFFINLYDFYNRVNKKIVNYRIIEVLICCGAFDSLQINRADLLNKLKFIKKSNFEKNKNIENLILNKKKEIEIKHFWNFQTEIIEEKSILGFFFLNNLYNIYKEKFKNIINKLIIKESGNIVFPGIIENIEENFFFNKKKIILNLINDKKNLKIKINNYLYDKNNKFLKKNNFLILIISNKLNKYNNKKILIIKNLINLKNLELC